MTEKAEIVNNKATQDLLLVRQGIRNRIIAANQKAYYKVSNIDCVDFSINFGSRF